MRSVPTTTASRSLTNTLLHMDKHRPTLPSVKSLLDLNNHPDNLDLNLPLPRSSRNTVNSSAPYHFHDGAHLRSRSSYQPSSSSSRPKHNKLPHDSRPSSSRRHHYAHNSHQAPLPSVNEVLGRRSNPVPTEQQHWPPLSETPRKAADDSNRPPHSSSSPRGTKKQGYPCERCGRMFTRKSDALKHIRVVHDRLKVFACQVCDRRFARKDYCTVRNE